MIVFSEGLKDWRLFEGGDLLLKSATEISSLLRSVYTVSMFCFSLLHSVKRVFI